MDMEVYDWIEIKGAREHNLKNIDLKIPKNRMVVVTGISGSGKSTLAFSTLYAEGQRRYIESLSSYARQFLGRVGKPDVDKIEGLTPAIAIDQKTTSKNPRSTVGTITEIHDYLRLFFARVGRQYCHKCGKPISSMSASDIIDEILKLPEGSKLIIMAPLVNEKKGTYADLIESLRHKGYIRAMIDGVMVRLDDEIELSKTKKHTIKVVVDRVVVKESNADRIGQDIEKALGESYGEVLVEVVNYEEMGLESQHLHYSEHMACFDCKISFEPLEPVSFSFNSPRGACPGCDGLGVSYELAPEKAIDGSLPISKGAIRMMYGYNRSYHHKFMMALCEKFGIDTDIPFEELPQEKRDIVLEGTAGEKVKFSWKKYRVEKDWQGLKAYAEEALKDEKGVSEYMVERVCGVCKGHRLRPSSLSVKVGDMDMARIVDMPISECCAYFDDEENFSHFSPRQKVISEPILKEIRERLFFLHDVGLGYLTLGRDARTISGGEAQRIRIASQIGSGLTGVMYVLDEPSIGLHERDTMKLIRTLHSLRDKGNSVIVVEHDRETIESADYIVDIGPGAGEYGGEIVFCGEPRKLESADTLTADYLMGRKRIEHRREREIADWLKIRGVEINNISGLNVDIPLGQFVCVTGVSGSGKSSLILQTLLPVAREMLNRARNVKKIDGVEIEGMEHLDKVIYLDQSPIGRTPRSNPATYTGVMDEIRKLFAMTKEAEIRGYKAGRFSFNLKGGRCEKCQGEGEIKIEMHFLPDVMVKCDACNGRRYNQQTLEVLYKGKNISDILEMSVAEALDFFKAVPSIANRLSTLTAVGLDYIRLGQNATTLSGGEAQRIKLSRELSRRDTGRTLYILDEPTTGLHFADVDRLTAVLHHLVDLGNSVIVIEHNMDMISNADYLIDMGPEGGSGGGEIVDCGTPSQVASRFRETGSHTGKYLAETLI
jgi:excinuclease ABC subunit A